MPTTLRPDHLLTCLVLLPILACQTPDPRQEGFPIVMDSNLQLELIATQPDIVTPIGLAIDGEDHLYVLESHTHSPLSDYQGPKFDRIKIGIDQNRDGHPEEWKIFADSITDGMNLAYGPDNTIYLACKDRVLAFRDTDRDLVSDQTDTLLLMKTPNGEVYDHAGILGVTLSPDGWLYISRGNTGGLAYEMTGSDGSTISHYGDGGNVIRMQPDGSQLEEVATGFWNPFGIKFSQAGRLFLSDNDPDSRGPNRLVEIVYGSDYGYQAIYGGSGIHPFLSWNGELPGTLPYAAPLGEAPCGIIDAGYSNFGAAYSGSMLASVWEENSIVRIPLTENGSTQTGEPEILIKGDSTFHPVAYAYDSHGALYFTDWVVRQYPNHGKGRIWRLSGPEDQPMAKPNVATSAKPKKDGIFVSRRLGPDNIEALITALQHGDAFTQTVARKYLSAPTYEQQVLELLTDESPDMRMQALLTALHSQATPDASILQPLLRDEREDIRRMTLVYIAKKSRTDLYDAVTAVLRDGHITPSLFETYLAAIRHLQPNFIEQYRKRSRRLAKQVERVLPEGYLLDLIRDPDLPAAIRAAALPYLQGEEVADPSLLELFEDAPASIQMGLLRLFTIRPNTEAAPKILQIVENVSADPELRTMALLSLSYQNGTYCEQTTALLTQVPTGFEQVALRYLCRCEEQEIVQKSVADFLGSLPADAAKDLQDIWNSCLGVAPDRSGPNSPSAWEGLINGQGSALLGKWVFHSRKAQCQNCHKIDGWGSDFGPALTHIGSSKSREQLLTAILEPSKEISPEWQGWYVTDKEGHTHYGRQIDVGFKNAELLLSSGEFITYEEPQSYGMSTTSLMPEGLENQLTVGEFNDLVTYLISLK
ncbi:MAG: hypothetical protein R2824_11520 [Saprospiraceae bacterium]|nr:c-type cytochrome [Lewinella sp.]